MLLGLTPIEKLEVSAEAIQFLKDNNVYYIGDLEQRTRRSLLDMPSADPKVILEIDLALRKRGLLFGTPLEPWSPKAAK